LSAGSTEQGSGVFAVCDIAVCCDAVLLMVDFIKGVSDGLFQNDCLGLGERLVGGMV
jgi:hypothetical protein